MRTTIDYISGIRNRPCWDLSESGAKGNDANDDSAVINAWLPTLGPCDIKVTKKHYVPFGFNLQSDQSFRFTSRGRLRGDGSFVGTASPLPTTKLNASGVPTGPFLSYGSNTLGPGVSGIGVANTYAKGDYVIIQNFPTDATTDHFVTNTDTSRSYDVGAIAGSAGRIDPANKRTFRRREINRVRAGAPDQFLLSAPLTNHYPDSQGIGFQKFSAVRNVLFEEANVQDLVVSAYLSDNFRWWGGKALRSTITVGNSLYPDISDIELDAEDNDCCVVIDGCRFSYCSGRMQGGLEAFDNALVRQGGSDFELDVILSGHMNSMYGVLCDTNYAESPDGFTDKPIRNGKIKILDSSNNMALFVSSNAFAAVAGDVMVDNLDIEIISGTTFTQVAYLKGVHRSTMKLTAPDSGYRLDGCSGIYVNGYPVPHAFYTLSDPRGVGATYGCTNIYTPNYSAVT